MRKILKGLGLTLYFGLPVLFLISIALIFIFGIIKEIQIHGLYSILVMCGYMIGMIIVWCLALFIFVPFILALIRTCIDYGDYPHEKFKNLFKYNFKDAFWS